MSNEEVARDILVALLGKINLPAKIGEDKYPAQWAAEAYRIIYKAVAEVGKDDIHDPHGHPGSAEVVEKSE